MNKNFAPSINSQPSGESLDEVATGESADIISSNSFESIAKERELADYAASQTIYSGLFINPDELYKLFPPSLDHPIRDPHVTVAYRPGTEKVFLDELGSDAVIRVLGYGNDGKNEGLLVEVAASSPIIQEALNKRVAPDKNGEMKHVRMHITSSISDGSEAVNTKNLDFKPINSSESPVTLTGNYKLFRNDGVLISSKETVEEMKQNNFHVQEVEDPDRL